MLQIKSLTTNHTNLTLYIHRPLVANFKKLSHFSRIESVRLKKGSLMSLRAPKHFKAGKHIFKTNIYQYRYSLVIKKSIPIGVFSNYNMFNFLATLPSVDIVPERFIKSIELGCKIKIYL